MSSNLPPGVTTSMLPGNTPDDLAYEAKMEQIYNLFHQHIKGHDAQDDGDYEALANAIYKMCGDDYANGMIDGIAVERLAKGIERKDDDEAI